jgi:hypothetical protein
MSNVIIAIAVLIIGFYLASYGIYENVEASRRTAVSTTIGAKINRLAIYSQDLREDLGGRPPLSTAEEATTGYATYSSEMLARERFGSVTFRYTMSAGGYYVCAESTDTGQTMIEAMQKVARDRPSSFVSGECGNSGTAVGGLVVTSMRIGG